jgi:uncharacterized protein (TIGR03435 family)
MRWILLILSVGLLQAQARPKFEVASIKPCKDTTAPDERTGAASAALSSPERLTEGCQTVKSLIELAYVTFANGRVNLPPNPPVEGGPSWINSERYQINAKPEHPQTQAFMKGPMLQTLLEDRFKLRIYRATREIPVYALSVAKGGSKLQPFKEGSCIPIDFAEFFAQFPPPPLPDPPQGQKYCPNQGVMKGPNLTLDAPGATLSDFVKLSLHLDRPIIDKTGLTGKFNIHLEYAPDQTTEDPAAGPSIFTALQQQLGLKLDPAKAPGELLIIDSIERPSEN